MIKWYHNILHPYLWHVLSVIIDNTVELEIDRGDLSRISEVAGQREKVVKTCIDKLAFKRNGVICQREPHCVIRWGGYQ